MRKERIADFESATKQIDEEERKTLIYILQKKILSAEF